MKFVKYLLAAFAYLGITLVVTYPLVFHFGDYFIGGTEDGSLSIWSIWWMKFALADQHQGLFDCHYLFYPNGVKLTFNAMPKMMGTIGILLQQALSLAASYNLIVILTFVASGLTAYWLVFRLLKQVLPSFMAGAFYAFSPYRLDQISHLNLLTTMLIPVYIVLIMKVRESLLAKSQRSWLYCCLAGVVLALTAYDTEHYAIFLSMFSLLFLLFYTPWRREWGDFKEWVSLLLTFSLIFIIAAVLFSPVLTAAISGAAESGDMLTVPTWYSQALSADATSFFIPRGGSDLISAPFEFITDRFGKRENSYLDLVVIALAFTGVWHYRKARETKLWAFSTMTFLLLSLGPTLQMFGRNSHIPMPFMLIQHIPFVNTIRAPSRYVVIASLTMAVLAGYGANSFFERLRRTRIPRVVILVPAVLIMLVFFLETRTHINLVSLDSSPVTEEIGTSNLAGSVIGLPLGWETMSTGKVGQPAAFIQLDQIFHHRPLVGGVVSRAPKEVIYSISEEPVLDYLSDPSSTPSAADRDPKVIDSVMEKFQIAFIVIHKTYPQQLHGGELISFNTEISPDELKNIDQYVIQDLGMAKFEETEEVVAYRRTS